MKKIKRIAKVTPEGVALNFYANGKKFPVGIFFKTPSVYAEGILRDILQDWGISLTNSQIRELVEKQFVPANDSWDIEEFRLIVPPTRRDIKEATKLVAFLISCLVKEARDMSISSWLKKEMEIEIRRV